MTNKEILQIALQQSAYDCNCEIEDFLSTENKVVLSKKHEKNVKREKIMLQNIFLGYKNR